MYAIYIYAYIGVVLGVNVGIYGIRGASGIRSSNQCSGRRGRGITSPINDTPQNVGAKGKLIEDVVLVSS